MHKRFTFPYKAGELLERAGKWHKPGDVETFLAYEIMGMERRQCYAEPRNEIGQCVRCGEYTHETPHEIPAPNFYSDILAFTSLLSHVFTTWSKEDIERLGRNIQIGNISGMIAAITQTYLESQKAQ